MSGTDVYYEREAEDFFARTVDLDLGETASRLTAHLAPGAHILDAGCGSGRDSRWFRARGFRVTSMDASPHMARLAEAHIGHPVTVLRFQQIEWHEHFDAIWAMASLLHVPLAELPDVFARLHRALVPGGWLFAAFKLGDGERDAGDGRRFTDLDDARLSALLATCPGLAEQERWTRRSRKPGTEHEQWLNVLARRSG